MAGRLQRGRRDSHRSRAWATAAQRRVGGRRPRTAAALAVAAVLATAASMIAGASDPAASATPPHATSWLTAGFDTSRTGYNRRETTLGPANAGHIHMLWSANLGAVMIAQPVEAAGVLVRGVRRNLIYEGTEHGDFYAIRADDGRVVWHRNLGSMPTGCNYFPGGVFGIGGAGAISFSSPGTGVVYILGGDGALHALDLASGAEQSGWPVARIFDTQEATFGGLNLFRGRLYATVSNHCDIQTPYSGSVVAIDVRKRAIVHRFYPAGPPSGGISGGGVWGPAGVSIDPANHDVFAATGNAITTPENYLYSDAVVDLYQSLAVRSSVSPKLQGEDVDFGSTPVLFQPPGCPTRLLAVENKNGALLVYSETSQLGAGFKQRLQIANIARGGFKGEPAWDPVTNMLYVANTSDSSSGAFRHGLVALKAGHDCSLSLAWQRTLGPRRSGGLPPPTAANGVVYYGDGAGNNEFAFDAASGRELWHSSAITGPVLASATTVNGMLVVPSWDHNLYAFGLAKP